MLLEKYYSHLYGQNNVINEVAFMRFLRIGDTGRAIFFQFIFSQKYTNLVENQSRNQNI